MPASSNPCARNTSSPSCGGRGRGLLLPGFPTQCGNEFIGGEYPHSFPAWCAGDPPSVVCAASKSQGAIDGPAPDTLAHWLTERYCYNSVNSRGRMYRCEIHHPPWRPEPVTAEIVHNSMAEAHGLTPAGTAPILHYAHRMEAGIWILQHVGVGPRHRERAAWREALLS
jgi:hypothetical protein